MTEHTTLAEALVAALADLAVIEKGNRANVGSYSYNYADLPAVSTATRPKLAEHGIVALTPVHAYGDGLACSVKLLHTSGETLDFEPFPFPHGKDAQATGSMVTYHRRYALLAALNIAAGDEDDDGASAQARQQEPIATEPQRQAMDEWLEKAHKSQQAAFMAWRAEEGLPPRKDMTASQAERVLRKMRELDKLPAPTGDGEGAVTASTGTSGDGFVVGSGDGTQPEQGVLK